MLAISSTSELAKKMKDDKFSFRELKDLFISINKLGYNFSYDDYEYFDENNNLCTDMSNVDHMVSTLIIGNSESRDYFTIWFNLDGTYDFSFKGGDKESFNNCKDLKVHLKNFKISQYTPSKLVYDLYENIDRYDIISRFIIPRMKTQISKKLNEDRDDIEFEYEGVGYLGYNIWMKNEKNAFLVFHFCTSSYSSKDIGGLFSPIYLKVDSELCELVEIYNSKCLLEEKFPEEELLRNKMLKMIKTKV